jgi:hypothetical protein
MVDRGADDGRTRRSGEQGIDDRRRFLAAVGAAGAAGLAGCMGLLNDEGSSDVSGDPTPDPNNPLMSDETKRFALPSGRAATEFDARLTDETTLVEGEELEAVLEADTENHRYVVDEDRLEGDLTEGTILLLSGVALRRITDVERDGSRATLETEFAPISDAISDGTVGWDARLGFDPEYVPDSDRRTPADGRVGHAPAAGGETGERRAGEDPEPGRDRSEYVDGEYTSEAVSLAAVGTTLPDGTTETVSPDELRPIQEGFEWTYGVENREYRFSLTRESEERMTVRVQVASPSTGDPDLALVAEGTVGTARSLARAEIEDGDVSSLNVEQKDLAVDLEVSVSGAGSGNHEIDWEVPTPFLKFVVAAGPVPVTFEIKTKLIGRVEIPAEASATGSAAFQYRGETGFSYEGTDVEVEADMGTGEMDPEPADSASNIGNDVDLQFGVAFPRFQIGVFDSLLVPYIHAGTTIGSQLSWNPLCKKGYVRYVVQAGYDFEVFGVTLSNDKETLYEDREESYGDSCEQGTLEGRAEPESTSLPSLAGHEHFESDG